MKLNEPTPILCGTDFSGNARPAANVAAALAMRLSAPLVLVHAKGTPTACPRSASPPTPSTPM